MKLNRDRLIQNFMDMIRIRTVSTDDPSRTDRAEFKRFRDLLKERYPEVFEATEAYLVGEYGVVIRIPGEEKGDPAVLMAHYDVVPADGDGWETDPFEPVLRDGRIAGRGTLDTKCTLCAIMEAARFLIVNGVRFRHDVILSFGGEEETCGTCCSEIVSFLEREGIRPRFVFDEGGTVVPEGVPGVPGPVAMVGVAEKGTANYLISIEGEKGGHASTPPKHTVIGRLAKAAVNIENHPFPARMSTPVRLMFREIADAAPAPLRPFFRHADLASPLVAALAVRLGTTFNAMVRSTCAVTVMEGRSAFNVLPDRAALGVNVRLLEGDSLASAAAYLKKVSKDPDVEVRLISGTEATGTSDIRCGEYGILKSVIRETWRGIPVAPYQMNGGTDSRYYERLTDRIYRFSPMVMTKEERGMVHGKNESISVSQLMTMTVFYIRLMRRL